MRNRALTKFAIVIAVGAAVAGCSQSSDGTSPTDESSPAVTSQPGNGLPSDGAPAVANPIDTTKFEAEPCSVASPDRLKKAGFDLKEAEPNAQDSTGPKCTWSFKNSGFGTMRGTIVGLHDRGLSALYQRRSSYGLFEEVSSVSGYPGVIYGTSDRRKNGLCALSVGVRDDQNFEVSTALIGDNPDYSNPCSVAQKVAEIAVETMKNGGS